MTARGAFVERHAIQSRAPMGDAGAIDRVTDPARLAGHLEDAAHVPGGHAAALMAPRTERDVAGILQGPDAVLVVGAQSSLTGGATPRGEVIVETRHFSAIERLAPDRVRVGAGVTLAALDEHLARQGGCYPPAPTYTGATIGGTIATNAAGAATFKYGTTRQWVEAMTVVLPEGDVLDIARGATRAHRDGYFDLHLGTGRVRVSVPPYAMPATPKLSAGYFAAPEMDLIDLFIGSEGTLGVVTAATLRVLPTRRAACLLFLTLRERSAGLSLVGALRDASMATWSGRGTGLDISAIEHMDARSLALVREDGIDRRLGLALDEHAALGLLVTVELPPGTTSEEVYDQFGRADSGSEAGAFATLNAFVAAHGALDEAVVAPPDDAAAVGRLVALREAVPVAVNQRVGQARRNIDSRIEKTAGDVVVPFNRLGELLDTYERELSRRHLDAAIWGHISDGNLHPNVIPASFADVESGREAMLMFGREAIRLGGAPLAEHGVGRSATKQRLLAELYGSEGIGAMRAVRHALDPRGILAPGVLFTR